jgi:hypothetical protein
MDKYRAPGSVVDGRLQVNQARLRAALGVMRDGDVVLTIERKKPSRTIQQNSYYHGVVVKLIADETGQDAESVHEFLKRECNAACVEMTHRTSGEVYEAWVGKSTAALNVNDFYDYVERCRAWAGTFLGLEIPDPTTED